MTLTHTPISLSSTTQAFPALRKKQNKTLTSAVIRHPLEQFCRTPWHSFSQCVLTLTCFDCQGLPSRPGSQDGAAPSAGHGWTLRARERHFVTGSKTMTSGQRNGTALDLAGHRADVVLYAQVLITRAKQQNTPSTANWATPAPSPAVQEVPSHFQILAAFSAHAEN